MSGQSQGALAKLGINGSKICFRSIKNNSVGTLVDTTEDTICGMLDHAEERVQRGINMYAFQVLCEPSPEELDVLLPLIGFAESPTDTFTLTDDFSSLAFSTEMQMYSGKVFDFTGCKVDKAIFRGQKGRTPIQLELHIGGTGLTERTSFYSSALTANTPYAFHQVSLNLESSSRVCAAFALAFDNHMEFQHNNSQNPTSYQPKNRTIHLAVDTPYTSDEIDLFTNAWSGASGDSGTLAFTNGDQSTSFALANVKAEATPPSILGKEEIRLKQNYKVYKSGSTAAVIVTHDATA